MKQKKQKPNLVRKARANFHLSALTNPNQPLEVVIEHIPDAMEPFMGSGDSWGRVHFPKGIDLTGLMYQAKKGNVFWKHKHPRNGELILITNEKGKARVYTEEDYYDIGYMESVFIPKDMFHAVVWEEDTDSMILFNPSFKAGDWEAFVDKFQELEKNE